VPVLATDVKFDVSGLVRAREGAGGEGFPVRWWDVFGETGLPIRTSVHECGVAILSRMLGLSPVQESVAFMAAEWSPPYFEQRIPLQTLSDLRAILSEVPEYAASVRREYGHASPISIATIMRQALVLEVESGGRLFGEPALDFADLMQTAPDGRGIISLINADKLVQSRRLYSAILLFLLSEMCRTLPEVGDLPKPRLVVAIDEAYLLFVQASPALLEMAEKAVRVLRSKGVVIALVTQSPNDIPNSISAQISHRITHALRAYTSAEMKGLKSVAQSLRLPEGMKEKAGREWMLRSITELKIGEALVSLLDNDGVPTPARRVQIDRPRSSIGAIADFEREMLIRADPLAAKYRQKLSQNEQFKILCHRLVAAGKWHPSLLNEFKAPRAKPAVKRNWLERLFAFPA
jgi:uncharacterized protein